MWGSALDEFTFWRREESKHGDLTPYEEVGSTPQQEKCSVVQGISAFVSIAPEKQPQI